MSTRRFGLLATLCLSVGVLTLAPGVANASGAPVEEARANGTFVQMTFNDPEPGTSDTTITDHLRNLITDAHPHSDVRVALHSITGRGIKDAIVGETPGQDLGAGDVTVVMDGTKMGSSGSLAWELKRDVQANGGRFVICGPNNSPDDTSDMGACLGNRATSRQHAKYVLIEAGWKRTGASQGYHSSIVWMGSANITASSGWEAYNDAATVYGDADLYNGLVNEIFDVAASESWSSNDFYDNPNGNGYVHGPSANVSVFASPETTTGRDQLLERLNDVRPGPGCTVAVMQMLFQGERGQDIARKLERIRWPSWPSSSPQCSVYVLVDRKSDGSPSLGDAVEDILCDSVRPVPVKSFQGIHDKALLISADYLGAYKQVVFTGSHNISDPAREENDEVLARVGQGSGAIYDRFAQHFSGPYHSTSAANAC
ncbi:MAG: hypothetical protein M3340_09455 [Actinomycetota bacterium]|nr:hypothetical protein [Actinomycetota bacterium]